ncbi:hypothetical protein ACI65C_008301 [Semiaphis heraclei]
MPLVFNDIEAEFNDYSMRGLPIPSLLKLLAVLRYYGTGNFQIVTGDLVGISQPTISRCIKYISKIIASKLPTFVKFPATLEEKIHNQVLFSNIAGFVGVDGTVTHIPILNPGGYLFTPVRNPQNRAEERYNKAHIATRNTAERLNGIIKRRFSCLSRKLATKLSTTLLIISACSVLHNIAIFRHENLPHTDEILNNNQMFHQEYNGPPNLYGNIVGSEFINMHFS